MHTITADSVIPAKREQKGSKGILAALVCLPLAAIPVVMMFPSTTAPTAQTAQDVRPPLSTFNRSSPAPLPPLTTPFQIQGGNYVVDVKIGALHGACVVDTGATKIVIGSEIAKALGGAVIRTGRERVGIADGSETAVTMVILPPVTVAGSTQAGVDGVVVAAPRQCLLGASFLSRFSRVALNYQTGRLELSPAAQDASN